MLWVVFALLTGAAIFSVLWPLARKSAQPQSEINSDIAFYEDRLAEIDKEVERSLIAPEDARAVKAEAARRLLVSADHAETKQQSFSGARVKFAAVVALIVVPAVALGVYAQTGHPNLPDDPLEARLESDPSKMDLQTAVAKVERHLAQNPRDGKGYEVLAPAYLKMGRAEDAARAELQAMALLGETPERLTFYGEALFFAANGIVTKDAQAAFAKAADGRLAPKASLYLGLAAEQDGNRDKAIAIWSDLIKQVPDAPWADALRGKIAALQGAPMAEARPETTQQGAAIAAMPEGQRDAAIRGMVDRLAQRLEQNGNDVEGWLRLVRAYKVLNEGEKARSALGNARHSLEGDAAATVRLDALAKELGLEG